jgi:hypothetical protein
MFAQMLGEALMMENTTSRVFKNMMTEYSEVIDNNEIAEYNFKRLYINN